MHGNKLLPNKTCVFPPQSLVDGAATFTLYIKYAPQSKNAVSTNINIVDTSIKHQISSQISGQSTSMVKGCMYICLI